MTRKTAAKPQPNGGDRVVVSLYGTARDRWLALQASYPEKSGSELFVALTENLGTPFDRALVAYDHFQSVAATALPPQGNAIVARFGSILRGIHSQLVNADDVEHALKGIKWREEP